MNTEPESALKNLSASFERIKKGAVNERALPIDPKSGDKILIEKTTLEHDKIKLDISELQAKIDRDIDLHDLRKEYIEKLFWLIAIWLGVVVLFVFMSGYSSNLLNNPDCRINCARFKLADSVLIAFITSTTASVLGLFYLVAKWLYPSAETKSDKEKKEGK